MLQMFLEVSDVLCLFYIVQCSFDSSDVQSLDPMQLGQRRPRLNEGEVKVELNGEAIEITVRNESGSSDHKDLFLKKNREFV